MSRQPPDTNTAAVEDKEQEIKRIMKEVEERKATEEARRVAEEEAAKRAVEEAKKKEAAAWAGTARRKATQEAHERANQVWCQGEDVVERRRLLAEAVTARSQQGTSPSKVSVSPQRLIVDISKSKGKGKARAKPVDGDPDCGNNDDENKEPCKQCKVKKPPCLQ
ncbi:hypothetical protein F5877DRAFT_84063 [Lentinula edodes]|nr:hypothetical protein F5877DRAFT_84063 [Lentinula edodes]